MSELKTIYAEDTFDEDYMEYHHSDKRYYREVYYKHEADKVIAEKDKEIEELRMKRCDQCQQEIYQRDTEIAELQKEKEYTLEHTTEVINAQEREIRHQKYRRCLDKAEMCQAKYDEEDARVNGRGASWDYVSKEMKYWERWRWRWDALAEKFKEAK